MRTGLFLLLAATAIGAATSQPAEACVIAIGVETLEADGVTDPAEIARLQARQDALVQIERQQQARRDAQAFAGYLARLGAEADRAHEKSASELASALVESLVPPVVRQVIHSTDCGYEWNGIVTDEAGYLMSEGDYLAAAGLPAERSDATPGYGLGLRRHMSGHRDCPGESRAILSRILASQFSQAELAHVWAYVHRLGFDRSANEWGTMAPQRLLAFSAGSGEPLRLAQTPPMNNWFYESALGEGAATSRNLKQGETNPQYWQALAEFLQTDTVARRQIATLDGALAGGTAAFCPDAHARMVEAASMMAMSPEEWRAWRRTAPPIRQD